MENEQKIPMKMRVFDTLEEALAFVEETEGAILIECDTVLIPVSEEEFENADEEDISYVEYDFE